MSPRVSFCAVWGSCDICGSWRPMTRDHDHHTKHIRGLLCQRCNTRLGWVENGQYFYIKSGAYIRWFAIYYLRIMEFLNQDTGIKFEGKLHKQIHLLQKENA